MGVPRHAPGSYRHSMAQDPPISFRGALKILGKDSPAWLEAVDGVLGGAVLAGGVVPGFGAIWGWADQKNEATGLLRAGVTRFTNRVAGTTGLPRHELVLAAHTVIVLTAFFDAARATFGKSFKAVKVTDREKIALTLGADHPDEPLIRRLYGAPVPSPSATRGFEENVGAVREWAWNTGYAVADFLVGVGMKPPSANKLAEKAAENYRSAYLGLMTAVPEFALWADQVEHAATQAALGRLEQALLLGPQPPVRDLRAIVSATNKGELARPIADVDTDGYGLSAVFPPVGDIFISPNYLWEGETHDDLDLFLARHFTSAEATVQPILLLGHPGAGKSLLMKVLAAKLSPSTYTAVRVPLRSVEANAPVRAQIDQGLSITTGGRVCRADLADSSTETIRVVLLDGLDELLQATSQDRHG
jgi:hypothetical protein